MHRVEFTCQPHQGTVQLLGPRRPPVRGQRPGQRASGQVGDDPAGDLTDLVTPVGPGSAHPVEDLPEGRHAMAGLGREVRTEVERLGVGREEDGHGPATLAGGGLHGLHIDGVDVRPLLTVHLDGHEVLVEQLGGGRVLEALVRHHMAPVTRGVADRQQNGHIAPPRFRESLRPPRPPVDGIVGMLKQIRRGHASQPVHANQPLTALPPDGEARAALPRSADLHLYAGKVGSARVGRGEEGAPDVAVAGLIPPLGVSRAHHGPRILATTATATIIAIARMASRKRSLRHAKIDKAAERVKVRVSAESPGFRQPPSRTNTTMKNTAIADRATAMRLSFDRLLTFDRSTLTDAHLPNHTTALS